MIFSAVALFHCILYFCGLKRSANWHFTRHFVNAVGKIYDTVKMQTMAEFPLAQRHPAWFDMKVGLWSVKQNSLTNSLCSYIGYFSTNSLTSSVIPSIHSHHEIFACSHRVCSGCNRNYVQCSTI